MFVPVKKGTTKQENYDKLLENLPYYLDADDAWYTLLANAAAVLDYFLEDVNWVGFYVLERGELKLGPFQGVAACTRIAIGNGVCGTAAERKETVRVDDVGEFPGHITCDADSASEIVVPLIKDGRLFGVLDIDSPYKARFDTRDEAGLKRAVETIVDKL